MINGVKVWVFLVGEVDIYFMVVKIFDESGYKDMVMIVILKDISGLSFGF